ncbi:MAG: hypothetical protein D6762_06575, partial [Candidatus Neomarinimicrobiota bacterium]
TELATYTPEQISNLFQAFHLDFSLQPRLKVRVLALDYWTTDPFGADQAVSAALYVPDSSVGEFPLLSIQHGTIFQRDQAPSQNHLYSLEGVIGVLMAANGYLAIAPDGLGLGINESFHPYLHEAGSALPVVDGLRACRSYACGEDIPLAEDVYLVGYSEGGYVTMAAHHTIETGYGDEISVTASVPMAGPYDIRYVAETILQRATYDNPGYFGYVFTAYNTIYGWDRLSEVFLPAIASLIPDLYDGNHSGGEINDRLPHTIADVFQPQFLTDFLGSGETDIKAAMEANSVNAWAAQAPILLVHGAADTTVPYGVSPKTVADMQQAGARSIRLITVAGNHVDAALTATDSALVWISSLRP